MSELGFERDPVKSAANFAKHGVLFADAVAVFQDALALTMQDQFVENEMRWIALGADPIGRLLLVVYTWRGNRIRIISARPATKRERRQYEEE